MHLLTGPSLPEVVLVLSLPLAVFGLSHSGSVHGLCCLLGLLVLLGPRTAISAAALPPLLPIPLPLSLQS